MNRPRKIRTAFSLVELLVAIGILFVLLSIFIPYAMSRREANRRIACADNLRQISIALQNYSRDNGGAFPRVIYDAVNKPNGYVAFTGADSDSAFTPDSKVQPNDVTACLWLLVRGKYALPNVFICPSTDDVQDPITSIAGQAVPVNSRGNFRKMFNLSYSFASPYTSVPGYRVNDDLPWAFALLADRNPGIIAPPVKSPPLELAKGNSLNHGRAGQNVLHPGGFVSFERTPYCGSGGDNIYTALRDTPLEPGNSPPADGQGVIGNHYGAAWNSDSYLVPVDSEGPR